MPVGDACSADDPAAANSEASERPWPTRSNRDMQRRTSGHTSCERGMRAPVSGSMVSARLANTAFEHWQNLAGRDVWTSYADMMLTQATLPAAAAAQPAGLGRHVHADCCARNAFLRH